ncbi:MAG: hypothetical protein WD690_07265 [Vicinamibacterales bacterium]
MLIGASLAAEAQEPLRVETLTFSEPATIADIDIDSLKGQPARLAWSPDAAELYLQLLDGDFGQASARRRHYGFNTNSGQMQDLSSEPDWASSYWTAKSAQVSPDGPAMKIDLKSEARIQNTVSTPMGGDLARGGSSIASGAAANDGVAAAYNRQTVPVHSMFLRGELVGEFVNSVIVPGMTFGWGPPRTKVIAYSANKSGRIVVMDDKGTRKEIARTKDAVLPAWSPDATRLAWLQKDGRKKFLLQVARVSVP